MRRRFVFKSIENEEWYSARGWAAFFDQQFWVKKAFCIHFCSSLDKVNTLI